MKTAAGCVAYVLAVGSYSGWAIDYSDATTPGWTVGLIVASLLLLWIAIPILTLAYWMADL